MAPEEATLNVRLIPKTAQVQLYDFIFDTNDGNQR